MASAFGKHFEENQGAWILFVALIAAVFWGYSTRRDVLEICDLAQPATEITASAPLDPKGHPISPTDLKAMVANLTAIKTEHTVDGELWRWQHFEGERLQHLCGTDTATADQ